MPKTQQEQIPSTRAHRFQSIAFEGGFLDGVELELSEGLNCIIGGRGAGKTTVLELVRYALSQPQSQDSTTQAGKRLRELLSRNLDGGRVRLGIRTREGLEYTVIRDQEEEPVVLDEEGKPTDLTVEAGFFRADLYSQNEVEAIADESHSQLDLIDGFESEQIAEIGHKIRQTNVALTANAGSLMPLRERADLLAEELTALPAVREKLKGYAASESSADAKAINDAHQDKAIRDRESRSVQELAEYLKTYGKEIGDLTGQIDRRIGALFGAQVTKGPNAKQIKGITQNALKCGREVDRLLSEAVERLQNELISLADSAGDLKAAHRDQDQAFRELLDKHQKAQGQATERTRLDRRHNDLLVKQRQLDETKEAVDSLLKERDKLLRRLSELRDQRFAVRASIAKRINAALAPGIRVSLKQQGNTDAYYGLLEESLRSSGTKVRHGQVAERLSASIPPADLVAVLRAKDQKALIDRAELNAEQAEKVIATLGDTDLLHEIETVELPDEPLIELKDGEQYKPSHSLSTGQKCTTILPILLLESERPLFIDQPEDNLDNRFIFETVLEGLRNVAGRRQLICITHNPNLVVLGNADRVFVLESDGDSSRLAKEGPVDACRAHIVTLLEGGEKAFKQRKERYGY